MEENIVKIENQQVRATVGPSGRPDLLPPVYLSFHHSHGVTSLYLSEAEARELGLALVGAADEWDNEETKRGEQYDEMRLEA